MERQDSNGETITPHITFGPITSWRNEDNNRNLDCYNNRKMLGIFIPATTWYHADIPRVFCLCKGDCSRSSRPSFFLRNNRRFFYLVYKTRSVQVRAAKYTSIAPAYLVLSTWRTPSPTDFGMSLNHFFETIGGDLI